MVFSSPLVRLIPALLSLSLSAGSVLAKGSGFNIKAYGTGYKSVSGSLTANNVGVTTDNDMAYTVEITLGGQNFTVLLDTGSSDLWLNIAGRGIELTNTSNLEALEGYGKGQVQGNIAFAELRIGDFTIESQAFLNASKVQDFDLTSFDGIMGMAFDIGSIYGTVQKAWGTEKADELARSPITALFAEDISLPNNFDVQLGRTSETEDVAEGTFVISSHAEGYESVASAPKLPRVAPEHWSVVVDAMLVNGQRFSFTTSRITGVPKGSIVAALDTGFSLPPLAPAAVDAIYGSIPGAVYDDDSQLWLVPCNGSTDVTFVLGGQDFPVHPLDLTIPVTATVPMNGQKTDVTVCINTYRYLTLDPNSFTGFDIVLGDAFLRNVYVSFDYGDWDPTKNNSNSTPFVQMVSTTDSATMWDEFLTERGATLALLPPTMDPAEIIRYEGGASTTSLSSRTTTSRSSRTTNRSSRTTSGHSSHTTSTHSRYTTTSHSSHKVTTSHSSHTITSTHTSATATKNADTLANLAEAVSADGTTSSGADNSWGSTYGKTVLALLGANLLVGVALLAVTLTMCARGMKGRSVGSRYAPVRVKDTVPAHDLESTPMKYSD